MNPAIQEMDPVQSNTATFYEAVPAVGPDGTDIMKLIPVQIVNRQFFQYPSSQHETHPTPQRAEAVNISSAPVKMFKANPELCNSVKKYLSQKQKTKLRTIAPSATPAVNIGKSGRVTIQLPVTGKSPELPRGQPSNTQVQTVLTVLAPELPEKPILTSSANASLSSGQPGVVNVLPIKSDSQGVTPQIDSALDTLKLLCNMANKTSCGPLLKGSPHLTLIPKGSRKPNSPMKWVVDEEDSALLPTPDPVNSVTSKILRVVAERENAEKLCDVITKPSHTVEPIASSVASEIIGVAAERENAEKLCDVITKPGPIPEPVPSFVASEILRVAAEREKASKQCDVVTMSVSRCSPGTSVDGMKHMLVIKNRKDPAQQQNSKFISILPKIAGLPRNGEEVGGIPKCPGLGTTVRKSEKLGKPPSQHQVTVKYPLPRGHRLQSPPDTQVGPVLASVVSPAVKKHVLTSSANSRLSPGFHNVVNLSPTTSVNQGGNPQSDSTLGIRKFLRKTSPGPPSKASKAHLRLIQKDSERPNSPMKWVVDDEDGPTAPLLDPIDSCTASEIFRVVAARENLGKHCDIIPNPEAGSSQGKNEQGQETLIVCDGKVFLLARNHSLQFENRKIRSPTAASKTFEFNRTVGPSYQRSVTASALEKRGALQIIPQDQSGEVIDLCDDDSSQPSVDTSGATHPITSDRSSGICCQIEKDTSKIECSMIPASWTSSLALEPCKLADPLLRHMFGITADVKIKLQRIDKDSFAKLLLSESMKSLEDNQELASGLQEKDFSLQDLCSLQDGNSWNGKVLKTEPEDCDSPTPLPEFYQSGSTLDKGTSCHIKSEPDCGYVEPIDEDFLSTDESDIPNSRDIAGQPQTPTCVDTNTNMGRMGRKRKRTMCPCCVPTQLEKREKWEWKTEQASRRGGKTKFAKKVVKTSGKINCQKVECKTAEVPRSESEITVSEAVKLHEQIKRLKELLHEKEAALEQMTNSVGEGQTI